MQMVAPTPAFSVGVGAGNKKLNLSHVAHCNNMPTVTIKAQVRQKAEVHLLPHVIIFAPDSLLSNWPQFSCV